MPTSRGRIKHTYLGAHLIVDFFGCSNINDAIFVQKALKKAASLCGAEILHSKFYRFSPRGLTGYLLLAESHISIHTWPEYEYSAVDVFTCGDMESERAIKYLKEALGARKAQVRTILRGEVNSAE